MSIKSLTTCIDFTSTPSSTFIWVKITNQSNPSLNSLKTWWAKMTIDSSTSENTNLFWIQSTRMWLTDSQSILRMTSNPWRGKHIRLILNLYRSTTTGHSTKTTKINIVPDVGVETASSKCSSLTGRPSSSTHNLDTNECVASESNKPFKHLPAMKHVPCMRLSTRCSWHGKYSPGCLGPAALTPQLLRTTCRGNHSSIWILFSKMSFLLTSVAFGLPKLLMLWPKLWWSYSYSRGLA